MDRLFSSAFIGGVCCHCDAPPSSWEHVPSTLDLRPKAEKRWNVDLLAWRTGPSELLHTDRETTGLAVRLLGVRPGLGGVYGKPEHLR